MKTAGALSVAVIGALAMAGAASDFAQAECYVQAPLRPVHRSYIRRDVVEPGVYEVARSPSTYGWTGQAFELPGAVIWHETPPVYRTVPVRVRRPGGWTWREGCVQGQAAVCRVHVPSTYVTAERQVLVKPGHRWAERTPPAVAYAERRVLLKPYKNYAHFQRPYIAYHREHLAIQPEGSRWVPAGSKPDC